jgi:hypothetical protein
VYAPCVVQQLDVKISGYDLWLTGQYIDIDVDAMIYVNII